MKIIDDEMLQKGSTKIIGDAILQRKSTKTDPCGCSDEHHDSPTIPKGDYLTVQATIQFKIHRWAFMNDKIGVFHNATDNELIEYCIENFEGHCSSVDGDAIEVSIIKSPLG